MTPSAAASTRGACLTRRTRSPTGCPTQCRCRIRGVNDVPEPALRDAGYQIIVGDGDCGAGWAIAARRCGDSQFVLCQGHPEYGADSLLREYRRDVRRALFGRGVVAYPRIPGGYLRPEAVAILEEYAERASARGGDPRAMWAAFPYDEVAASIENTWAAGSAMLYANWLQTATAASPA